MFEIKPTPLNVSSEDARKMPRMMLLALLVVFIFTGLFSRDIWSSAEARSLAEVLSVQFGDPASWLFPFASDEVVTAHGPLPGWIGAILVHIFSRFVDPLSALRTASLLWFALSTACIWYGTWFLARRKEAQPVSLAFGRQAPYRDFGRLTADTTTLFFVSLFGLVVRQHEAGFESAELAFACAAYFGCAWSLTRPYWGSALAGAACGANILCSNFLTGGTVLAGCLISHVLVRGVGRTDRKILTTIASAFVVFSLWPLAAYTFAGEVAGDYFNLWAQTQITVIGIFDPQELFWFFKHFIWYLCPVWPFALRAVWMWRKNLSVAYIQMPLSFCAAWLIGFVFSADVSAETLLSVIIAPLCVLAAFGLLASRRNAKSMLELFSVAVFTLALAGAWVYFAAWTAGWPPKMHFSILRLVADESVSHAYPAAVAVSLIILLFWLYLCARRLMLRPIAFWNGPWLSASGLTALWITAVCLFGPAIDSNRTYANIAHEMTDLLKSQNFVSAVDCVRADTLSLSERSAISWHSGAVLTPLTAQTCRFALIKSDKKDLEEDIAQTPAGVALQSFRPRSDTRYILTPLAPRLESDSSVPESAQGS